MAINKDFNGVSYPYTPYVRHMVQVNSVPDEYKSVILNAYKVKDNPEYINNETAKWGFTRCNLMSLSSAHDEHDSWMKLLSKTAYGDDVSNKVPLHAAGVGTWGTDRDDVELLIRLRNEIENAVDNNAQAKYLELSATANFPYGDTHIKTVAKQIERIGIALDGYKGQKTVEVVADYQSWLNGDADKVQERFQTEAELAHDQGLKYKVNINSMAHVMATRENYFDSVYEMTIMALDAGADIIKTSTDKAIKSPYSDKVPRDIGSPEAILPVMLAVRDYNKSHSFKADLEIAGGQESLLDIARVKYLSDNLCGKEMENRITISGSYMLARNLMQELSSEMKDVIDRKHFGPQSRSTQELPELLRGL